MSEYKCDVPLEKFLVRYAAYGCANDFWFHLEPTGELSDWLKDHFSDPTDWRLAAVFKGEREEDRSIDDNEVSCFNLKSVKIVFTDPAKATLFKLRWLG